MLFTTTLLVNLTMNMQFLKSPFFRKLTRMVIIYFLYIVVHYVSANLYQQVCVPIGWIGFITSPFTIVSPQCQALRWLMFNTGSHINAMWMIFGAWMINIIATYGPFDAATDE